MGISILSFRFICFFLLVSQVNSTYTNETDKSALIELKNSLYDGPNEALNSWNDSSHFCDWQGVECGKRHQRVTSLRLRTYNLSGVLPSVIGNLSFLRIIDFSNNELRGEIPKQIGLLSRLQSLNLSTNFIEGEIPPEIANCSNLEYINFRFNNLTGKIPSDVGFLSKLTSLLLRANALNGNIPSSIGNLTVLQRLSLSRNSLEGNIPYQIGLLKDLVLIQLVDNKLSGMLPFSLYNLSSIVELSLANNNFYGVLDSDMGLKFPNLRFFTISSNQFTGSVPSTISNITGLVTLSVSSNNLTGKMPENLGVLKNLEFLNVGHNDLGTGQPGDLSFLNSLINASSLTTLSIKSNFFGGILPVSLVNMTQLSSLALGTNDIHGSIPDDIGNLINLIGFGIEENQLTGAIPSSIGSLESLGVLALGSNRLSGFIPSTVGNLTRLFLFGVENNLLEGNIPLTLKTCKKLQQMSLAQNKLNGTIPESFLGHFQQLQVLDLHTNFLTGSVPRGVGDLKNLRELYLSDNKLSGEITTEIGDCSVLEYLDLSSNLFYGNIPVSLSSLKAIQVINLSHNNLSGIIPKELQDLSLLQNLNLSSNNLQGEVPKGGVFSNVSQISLYGNKNLCGGIAGLRLPLCATSVRYKKRLSVGVIIAITIASLLCLLAPLIIFLALRRRKNPDKKSSLKSSLQDGHLRVSYQELLEATGGFASSNLIGMGSFGSVYKGVIGEDDRQVAVKVLNLEKHGASKGFMTECQALGAIRHRNLLKIVTSCSSVDFKGDEFMALVFEFMPNGSLEKWLHESRTLSFSQRLDIVIDVAYALEYLHFDCDTPIAHCDLKPSNVLLDKDMVGHVGDFGLARLIHEISNQSISTTMKGSIGYVAPEYGMLGKVSTQGDVYSFGILLLEIITGKRPTDDMFNDNMNLHTFAKLGLPEKVREMMDPGLLKEFEEFTINDHAGRVTAGTTWECLLALIEIGVACSEEMPYNRMNMKVALRQLLAIKKKLRGKVL